MLAALRRFAGLARSAAPAVRAARFVRGGYDAAKTTDENRRHWANADALGANAANSPGVRRMLRNRARYEVANNSYARGIVNTLANDVVGTGPRLQLLTEAAQDNRRVEAEFVSWAKAVGLAAKLRTMRATRAESGEAFGLLTTNPALPTPVKLDLRLIEADQVTTPDLSLVDPAAVDGIEFDAAGNPTAYHVLREHPGEASSVGLTGVYDRVPAEAVIHSFRVDRPGQRRGVPEITPALPLFAQLRRYTLATLAAAETAAMHAGLLQTDSTPEDTADAEPFETVEIERGMLTVAPAGWKLGQMKAEQPTTTYGEFKREVLKEIARCLSIPFNIAAGDSSGYNYSSGRLDHQTYFKAIRVDRDETESVVLDRIFRTWLDEAALIDGYLPQRFRTRGEAPKHEWFWDGHEHVDPQKEAQAQQVRLIGGMTTFAAEYARQGQDWEEAFRQRAREQQLANELGLALPTAAPAANTTDEETDDEEAPEAARPSRQRR